MQNPIQSPAPLTSPEIQELEDRLLYEKRELQQRYLRAKLNYLRLKLLADTMQSMLDNLGEIGKRLSKLDGLGDRISKLEAAAPNHEAN